MTSAPPSRTAGRKPARHGAGRSLGAKALMASASMAIVLGGWAAIAAQSVAAGAGAEQRVLAPLPTLAAPGRPGADGQPANRLAAPSDLRSVSAPPVAVTRSSR